MPFSHPSSERDLPRYLLIATLLMTSIKMVIGQELQLFGDEAFYWWESQHLAPAYSDLPFVTAILVALGTAVLGDTYFGVRLLFLLIGALLPMAVYFLAAPITGRRDAYYAALASFAVPMAATLGLLAIPDVPLVVVCTFLLGVLERALRTGLMRYWVLGGLLNAVGFCIHYRFAAFIAAAGLFFVVTQRGRLQWQRPGFYLAILLSLPGLYPLVSFNLANEFGGVLFHFSERHGWVFNTAGLGYWWQQAVLVTPLLFLTLGYGVFHAAARARAGDWQRGLVVIFSLVYVVGFGLVNPWADQRSTTLHWPLPGYVFALVLLPETLRFLCDRWRKAGARFFLLMVPVSGLLAVLGMLGYASITAWGERLPTSVSRLGTSKMSGWEELGQKTAELLEVDKGEARPMIVTADYHDAAQIAFMSGDDSSIFTTDMERAVRDGRALQIAIWGRDKPSLKSALTDGETLLVLRNQQASGGAIPEHAFIALNREFCELFDWGLVPVGTLSSGADKIRDYVFLRSTSVEERMLSGSDLVRTTHCQPSATALIQTPRRRAQVFGMTEVLGFAFQVHGVERVDLLIDGEWVSEIPYGEERRDLRAVHFPALNDPNDPALGFRLSWDTSIVTPGAHELSVLVTTEDGKTEEFGRRPITVLRSGG